MIYWLMPRELSLDARPPWQPDALMAFAHQYALAVAEHPPISPDLTPCASPR